MTTLYVCDGCGDTIENPTKLGAALKRDYCATCAPNAKDFIAAEEAERAVIQSVFVGKRQKLIERHGANNFKLPDVPDAI